VIASYARIVPENSYDRAYDYAVPEALRAQIHLGSKVRMPLRRTETTGIVVELLTETEFDKVRAIVSVVGDRPVVPGPLFALARWISDYYCAPLAAALRCVLPEPVRQEIGSLMRLWVEPRAGVDDLTVVAQLGRARKQLDAWHHLREKGGGWLSEL